MLELLIKNQSWSMGPTQQPTTTVYHGSGYNYDFIRAISMSSDGTRFVVGNDSLYTAGAANIFFFNGTSWDVEKSIPNPYAANGYAGDFGASVSLSGDGANLLIGYPGFSTTSNGRVFFYTRTGTVWTQRQALGEPVGPAANNRFGNSIKISRDSLNIAVGSPGNLLNKGAVHIYQRTSATALTYRKTLKAADPVAGNLFGENVNITDDGTRIVITSPGNSSIYVFAGLGAACVQEAKLSVPDLTASDKVSIDASGTYIIVGTPMYDANKGKVRIFNRTGTTWNVLAELIEPEQVAESYFGATVIMSSDGTKALVTNSNSTAIGKAKGYLYSISPYMPKLPTKSYGMADFLGSIPSMAYSFGDANLNFKTIALTFFGFSGSGFMLIDIFKEA